MKEIIAIILIFGLIFTACDTELGHQDHDHDGDGIQDHAPEEHEESLEEHNEEIVETTQ